MDNRGWRHYVANYGELRSDVQTHVINVSNVKSWVIVEIIIARMDLTNLAKFYLLSSRFLKVT